MMETLNGGSQYMKMVHSGVHMNLNSALYGLVTPPRRATRTPPSGAALSRSVPAKSVAKRESPSRLSPCQQGGLGFYAGAKFGERPPPTELPKPPNHWVQGGAEGESCLQMTHSLKVLLKVQS